MAIVPEQLRQGKDVISADQVFWILENETKAVWVSHSGVLSGFFLSPGIQFLDLHTRLELLTGFTLCF